ncbi:MAG: OmpA family protein [Acidobacteriota bacterium]|nr:OmpA family protein [Acidobacteriota bacterium]
MRYVLMLCGIALLLTGCATKKYVEQEVTESETRTNAQVDELKQAVEETQTEIRDLARELNLSIEGLEKNTEELAANDAKLQKIASDNTQMIVQMGQFRFQKTLSESEANFKSSKSDLTDGAREQLDKFAELLVSQNRMVHIEIQGHADSSGKEDFNIELGQSRAESVRDYLYKKHDIPLHLMNVITFGSSDPIADNSTREGRAKNRRVVLVVRVQVK